MKAPEIREKMESLKTTIRDAEISVRVGNMVDLTGLDRNVAVLCNHAIALPPQEARELQPLMADMINDLERLGIALRDYRDDLKKK